MLGGLDVGAALDKRPAVGQVLGPGPLHRLNAKDVGDQRARDDDTSAGGVDGGERGGAFFHGLASSAAACAGVSLAGRAAGAALASGRAAAASVRVQTISEEVRCRP